MKKIILIIPALVFILSGNARALNKDSLIVSSFIQGKANNCASIALIKAAMLKYGYKNMFILSSNGNQYHVTLKDGTILDLTEDERKLGEKLAKFYTKGLSPELGTEKDSVLFYATLAYSCIAKFVQVKGYWGCEGKDGTPAPLLPAKANFKKALSFISNTSVCTDYCFRLLGFHIKDNKINDFHIKDKLTNPGIILYSWVHAVAVYNNQLDCHGNWMKMADALNCSEFQWYIEL